MCIFYTECKLQELFIHTKYYSDEQKKRIKQSAIALMKTYNLELPDLSIQKKMDFESEKIFNELKCDITTLYSRAVKNVVIESIKPMNVRRDIIEYFLRTKKKSDNIADFYKEGIIRSTKVIQFYYEKADEFVEKLKQAHISSKTMKKVYNELENFKRILTTIKTTSKIANMIIDDKKMKDIQEKWKKEAANIQENNKSDGKKIVINKADEKKPVANKADERMASTNKTDEKKIIANIAYESDIKVDEDKNIANEIVLYRQAYQQWKNDVPLVQKNRILYVNKRKNSEKNSLIKAANEKRDAVIAEAKVKLEEQNARKEAAEIKLASLGIFKLKEKKIQKDIIEQSNAEIDHALSDISAADSNYEAEISKIDEKISDMVYALEKEAEDKFPIPIEPLEGRLLFSIKRGVLNDCENQPGSVKWFLKGKREKLKNIN